MLLRLRGWLVDYLGERETAIDATNMTVREVLQMLDKGDGEIVRAVNERRLFISVHNSVVYDLAAQLSNNDLVTVFPIGSGG